MDITFTSAIEIGFAVGYDEKRDLVQCEKETFQVGEQLTDVDLIEQDADSITVQCGDGCVGRIERKYIVISE